MVDLSSYDLKQLQSFRKRIEKEIERRTAIDRKKALEEVRAFAKARGISLRELAEKDKPSKGAPAARNTPRKRHVAKIKIKYRHPNQHDLTWSGRGRKPKWVAECEAAGNNLTSLEV